MLLSLFWRSFPQCSLLYFLAISFLLGFLLALHMPDSAHFCCGSLCWTSLSTSDSVTIYLNLDFFLLFSAITLLTPTRLLGCAYCGMWKCKDLRQQTTLWLPDHWCHQCHQSLLSHSLSVQRKVPWGPQGTLIIEKSSGYLGIES